MRGIAISGRSASGKSVLAGELQALGYTRIGFADALKQDVRDLYGLEKSDPGGLEKLIEFGDACRGVNRYHWVSRFHDRARWAKVCGVPIVCDDLRFDAEYEYLRACGFVMVRLEVDALTRFVRLERLGRDSLHAFATNPGEAEMDKRGVQEWDVVIRGDVGAETAEALRDHARWIAPLPSEVASSLDCFAATAP